MHASFDCTGILGCTARLASPELKPFSAWRARYATGSMTEITSRSVSFRRFTSSCCPSRVCAHRNSAHEGGVSCRMQFESDGWQHAASQGCLRQTWQASRKHPPTIPIVPFGVWRMAAAPAFLGVNGQDFRAAARWDRRRRCMSTLTGRVSGPSSAAMRRARCRSPGAAGSASTACCPTAS